MCAVHPRRAKTQRAIPLRSDLRFNQTSFGTFVKCVVAIGRRVSVVATAKRIRFEPQCAGRGDRIHPDVPPPGGFIATMMNFAMVSATQRDGEFIADLPPE